jgi:hypothetical protein
MEKPGSTISRIPGFRTAGAESRSRLCCSRIFGTAGYFFIEQPCIRCGYRLTPVRSTKKVPLESTAGWESGVVA